MKFEEAYSIAREECAFINRATEVVINAMLNGEKTPCYLFSIGRETFYFGFDGVDLHKGKHTPERSETLIARGETWIVRN